MPSLSLLYYLSILMHLIRYILKIFKRETPPGFPRDEISQLEELRLSSVPIIFYAAFLAFLFLIASETNGQTTHATAIKRRMQDTGRVKNSA